ncbi:MAG: hypothetical protein JNM27_00535 [Leptospirales bacterium]|nr:hypothetical protein [Leptospirales bacterium]
MKKPVVLAGVGIVAILVIALFFLLRGDDPVEKTFADLKNKPMPSRTINENVLSDLKWKDLGEGAQSLDDLSFDQIVALLRKKYGDQLKLPYMRIRMLEELLRFLKQKYPDTWVQMLQEILGTAFPDQAASLFDQSEKLYKFNKYLEENQGKLNKMSDEERRSTLWSARRDLFGEDAEQIWAGDRSNEKVADTLKKIKESKDMSAKDKLKAYQSSLNDAYGKALPGVLEKQRQLLVNSFVDAVQPELSSMNSIERSAYLKEVRTTMGMDDAAISRWDKLDADRDQRWSNGEIYTQERKEIVSRYSGDEREKKLDELRRKLFGEEAESIKNEEASGYFRFAQQRRFGRE